MYSPDIPDLPVFKGEPMVPAVSRRKFLTTASTAVGAAVVLPMIAGCDPGTPKSSSGGVELSFFNQSRGQVDALNSLTDTYFKSTGVKINVETPGPGGFT